VYDIYYTHMNQTIAAPATELGQQSSVIGHEPAPEILATSTIWGE